MHLSLTDSPREIARTLAAQLPAAADPDGGEGLCRILRAVIVVHRATFGPVRRGEQILDLIRNREDLQEALARLPGGLGASPDLAEAKQVLQQYLLDTPPQAKARLQSMLSVALAA